jgi:hypothetical protein
MDTGLSRQTIQRFAFETHQRTGRLTGIDRQAHK